MKKILFLFLFCFIAFCYSFFIERHKIIVNREIVKSSFDWKVAFISDLHLGKWKGASFLERVVESIEREDVEAVLIGGDFLYKPNSLDSIEGLIAPLERLSVPIFAVLGNHDEIDDSFVSARLRLELERIGVVIIEGSVIPFIDKGVTLVGLGDHWAKKDESSVLKSFEDTSSLVVLTHSPDTTLSYPAEFTGITLSGHTHGGQIIIPWIYKSVIPCKGAFTKGMHYTENGRVFVSSGLGEVVLPLRFFVPPQIEILQFKDVQ